MLCNSGTLPDALSTVAPNICPDSGCTESQSCTDEDLRDWAEVVCQPICESLGLTLYPNATSTKLYDTVNLGCPNRMMFNAPADIGPPTCEVKGTLPQDIEFTNSIEEIEEVDVDDAEETSAIDKDSTGEDSEEIYQDSKGCSGFARSFCVTVISVLIVCSLN